VDCPKLGGGFVTVPALRRYNELFARFVIAISLAVIAPVSLAGVATSRSTGISI
jgi:uncharacterized membrane protein YfcA